MKCAIYKKKERNYVEKRFTQNLTVNITNNYKNWQITH